jgi:hypothetical protein
MRKWNEYWSGRHRRAALSILLTLAISGCSKTSATVTGHVRYQGAAVPAGNVTFHGPDNQTSTAIINSEGSYTATKVPLGLVKVAVTTPPPVSAAKVKLTQQVKKGQIAPQSVQPVSIPKQYGDPEKSGLALTVTTGSQPFDIDLK